MTKRLVFSCRLSEKNGLIHLEVFVCCRGMCCFVEWWGIRGTFGLINVEE